MSILAGYALASRFEQDRVAMEVQEVQLALGGGPQPSAIRKEAAWSS